MIAIGQPVALVIKSRHHTVSLERHEASPLHIMCGLASPGDFLFKLTVNGQLRMCRPDALAVRDEFREICRQIGLFSVKKPVELAP
jgi:hypothetical protein